nr:GRIP and coiled-coil domain-containing protein 2 isoform X1 [Tanacetum cinerariifolium]
MFYRIRNENDDYLYHHPHGFKSLTTSKLVPRFTRPVTDLVDGLWVTCDRALMRQPALRLSVILYWALMHALLAAFVV